MNSKSSHTLAKDIFRAQAHASAADEAVTAEDEVESAILNVVSLFDAAMCTRKQERFVKIILMIKQYAYYFL